MTEQVRACRPCQPQDIDRRAAARRRFLCMDGHRKEALETGRTRLLVAGVVFAFVFAVIGLRILDLAALSGAPSHVAARHPDGAPHAAQRADIVDRNGNILATTLPVPSLYANPREVAHPKDAAERLSRVLPDVSPGELAARLSSDRAFIWLKRGLSPRQQYRVNRLGIPGLYFREEERRFYPQGDLTAHVVGFTDIDNKGLAGIEQSFDEVLAGQHRSLRLSLDLRVQHILTEELSKAMAEFRAIGAAGVVMDARTGELVAMASLPSFNPANPGAADSEARFNRATLGLYEMGSVFKIFTTASVLESGAVRIGDRFDVSKPIRAARFTIRDYKPKDGKLTVPEIFMYSSNIGTVHMAMEAGTEVQQNTLAALGLTTPASVELPEVGTPMLPSPWREINTMTISYGHGLAVNPVQLTSAVAATVNGGVLHQPTLLTRDEAEAEASGKRVFSASTSGRMRQLMRLTVEYGTGGKADAEGYLVGGKTGTADKLRGGRYARDARIASFVGAFPMDDPRYVVFAMVDEPKGHKGTFGFATGGWVAAPVVREVISRAGPLLGVEPRDNVVVPEKEEHPLLVKVGAVKKDVRVAAR
ncbi:peptidoglycan D,D-transpeptidase FtsI family protein [Ferruginivarius sediminum]|uniref:Penicillin-binding protein 2 n=1 Tax=Ferruginivarius sediminum TaxID=2661937 RepID=A0A369TA81_9PROT|nr:penicillin-binding protein 2 [Ferruginivarius sediminum]RDD61285.1 penicillin-binding protein 2 [Ferruginivarius sediminum]